MFCNNLVILLPKELPLILLIVMLKHIITQCLLVFKSLYFTIVFKGDFGWM